MKISIIGAGIMGLSAAWALERLGHQVTVFEQGEIPNPQGSSHDAHRAIRYAYGAERGYQKMVGDAYALWQRLWDDLGETLYVETGTLCLGDGGSAWIRESADSLASGGHAVEWLSPAQLAGRFPMLGGNGIGEAFHLPSGGVLLADRILAALARLLRSRGVELRPHTPVRAVDPDRGWVTLEAGSVVGADAVLVAAGAWVRRLLPVMARRVTPSRQVVAYLAPPAHLLELWRQAPLIIDIDRENGFYLQPPVAGTGLKIGDHHFSLSGDPDAPRVTREGELDAVIAACRARFRDGAQFRIERLKDCFYTVEPEERFIVEPIGLAGWVVSACSGHAFKFGALIGSTVAGAIDAGDPGDITLWARGLSP